MNKNKKYTNIPDPNTVFPNEFGTTCFIKNVVKAPNVFIGDYTYYDSENSPEEFEKNNILFNYPIFGDKLIIGKFCQIAHGTQFIMGAANHRLCSASTYPFNIIGGDWAKIAPAHLDELPHKGDTVVGNDVWFGRNCVILPGVKIGDGAIVAAHSVVTKDVAPYTLVGGNPAKPLKKRFDDELISLLSELKWWDFAPQELAEFLPNLCDPDLKKLKIVIKRRLNKPTNPEEKEQ